MRREWLLEERWIPATDKGVHIYILRPDDMSDEPSPLFINFHGGGFIKGRADRDRLYCSHMASRLNIPVWDVDYALAPEKPFPAAVNETYELIHYIFTHHNDLGIDPQKIILSGHSAGSNLITAALIKIAGNNESSMFHPAGIILDYLPADLVKNPLEKLTPEERLDTQKIARAVIEKEYLDYYFTNQADALSPLASPILAPPDVLSTFPSSLIITAGQDPLRAEGDEFASRLARAGVTVVSKCFVNSRHGFTTNRDGEWEEALKLHENFARSLI